MIDENAFKLAFSGKTGKFSRTIGKYRFIVWKYEEAKEKLRELENERN